MRYILTGGTGLIGKALSADLIRDGQEVTIPSRSPETAKDVPKGARVIGWNARNEEGWVDYADGAFAIINLAGTDISEHRWTEEYKARILESRIDAGMAVVSACEKMNKKPSVLIQASGIGYYGSRGDDLLTEWAAPGSDFLARVAVSWEDSTKPVDAMNIRCVIVRSGG